MLKILILTSDMESLKTLCNTILNRVENIQICGISTNLEEFITLGEKLSPDIIYMNASDYLQSKFYSKTNLAKCKIIFCNTATNFKNSPNKLLISRNSSANQTIELIKNFVKQHDLIRVRNVVIKILEELNFDFKILGTTYLLETILYCYENRADYVFENLEKNVYPQIAKKYNSDANKVKWSITRAINSMNTFTFSQKHLSANSKVDIYERTTAKQLITTLVTKLN